MTAVSRWCVGVALMAAFVAPVGLPTAACAGTGDRAALVVDTGGTVHRYCVSLPDDSVSGTELIVLAAEQHGLSYRFGYGGNAVCMLAGVGTSGDDCFERYPDFWGYWRGDGSGGWSWSGSGAGSTRVSDGDVEGWSWGSGSDGSSHPAPPRTTFGSVCPVAAPPAEPEPDPEQRDRNPDGGGGDERPRAEAKPDAPVTSASSGDVREPRQGPEARRPSVKRERPQRATTKARASRPSGDAEVAQPEADDERAASATSAEPSQPGPPAAGVAALVIAGALGGTGSWLARRRRRASA